MHTFTRIGIGTLLVLVASASFLFASTKYQALGYGTSDYSFYLSSIARVADSTRDQTVSIHPDGYNMFRFTGTEAQKSIHTTVHFEPIKYVEALVFKISPSPLVLFLFITLLCVLPIAYLMVCQRGSMKNQFASFGIAAAYLIQPLLLLSVANDLRPYTLLAPLFFAAFLAIEYRRPQWEQLLLLNSLFLIREEAFVLGAALTGYLMVRNWSEHRSLSEAFRSIKWFMASFLIWAAIIGTYYSQSGYQNSLFERVGEYLVPLTVLAVAGVAALFIGRKFLLRDRVIYRWIAPMVLLGLAGAIGLQFVFYKGQVISDTTVGGLLFNEPFAWLFWVVLLSVWMAFYGMCKDRQRIRHLLATYLCVLIAIQAWFLVTGKQSPLHSYLQYQTAIPTASAIFAFRETLPRDTAILADTQTLQAFYEFDRAYSFESLPFTFVRGDERRYPQNASVLAELLSSDISTIVIEKARKKEVQEIAKAARLTLLHENARYVIYRVEK